MRAALVALGLAVSTLIAVPTGPASAGDVPVDASAPLEQALRRAGDLPASLGAVSRVERQWAGRSTKAAVCGVGPEEEFVPVKAVGGYTWFTLAPTDGGYANVGVRVRLFDTAAAAAEAWSRIMATASSTCSGPNAVPWEDSSDTRIGTIHSSSTVRAGARTAAITQTSSFVRASTGSAERTGTAIGVWRLAGRTIVEVLANRSVPAVLPSAWSAAVTQSGRSGGWSNGTSA